MRFLGRSLTGLFLLAATLGLLALAALNLRAAMTARAERDSAAPSARERVFSANVVTVTPQTLTPVLSVHGELASRRTLDLRTRVGGTVVELAEGFETGGRVQAGELLLRIDPTDLKAALELAETDLTQAKAELRDAIAARDLANDDLANAQRQADIREAALARQSDLVARGVGTEAAVENAALAAASAAQAVLSKRQSVISAAARVSTAEATVSRNEIALAEAQRRLAETEVRAEFAGTLADVSVLQGGVVTANEQLARIIDSTALEVSFRVSAAQYANLLGDDGALLGAEVTVRLDATGVDLVAKGRIARESADVGDGQTGRLIFATLEATPGLRPGDFVNVEVSEPEIPFAIRLPSSSLDARNEVLVLGEDDRLEIAQVELLRRQGDDVIVRARGLAGREVVTERNPTLGAGIRIRPVRDGVAQEVVPELVDVPAEKVEALRAAINANTRMPATVRDRILAQLDEGKLPKETLERLESRMK